jgi:hypothetical protein
MLVQGNERPECFSPSHPPGAICVASGELARYPAFTESMLNVLRPKGTTIPWHAGLNVAANFNNGVREGLANGAQWVWIMGDDHEFEPDALLRLLERELDIVVPVVARRQPPFIPVLFKAPQDDTPRGQFPPYHWSELPQHGVHEVYTAGSAGMLIRKHVLEGMTDPWFETGHMGNEYTFEDTYFCLKAHQAGFRIYADMDVQMDHWTPMSVRPVRHQGRWAVAVNLSTTAQALLTAQSLINMTHDPESQERTKARFDREHAITGGETNA